VSHAERENASFSHFDQNCPHFWQAFHHFLLFMFVRKERKKACKPKLATLKHQTTEELFTTHVLNPFTKNANRKNE
jgi:hypothetical protein